MDRKGKKALKIIFTVLALVIVGGFALNWYLRYRLENSLREKFREEISKATDGFYTFSYDKLSVGLFSGELALNGVVLNPDSAVYEKWKKGDSLPDLYYKIKLEEIRFRGINLTWRRDFKNLDFSLFEIKTPDIQIFQPVLNSSLKSPLDKEETKESKTLYQLISTYIDELTVKEINLENAKIHYTIQDPYSAVVYSLIDANFRAYGFLLNKDSYSSGKLLYCDDFEFIANTPQNLLYSDQLILNTNNIKLSTIDELIQIEGVRLHPSDEYLQDKEEKTGAYVNAEIESVLVKGVKFERKDAKNFLDADSFDISSTAIEYYNVSGSDVAQSKDTTQNKDSINKGQPWSLYTIVSPLLQRVSIGKIGIEKTRFDYTNIQNGKTDVYKLDQFDFHANSFLIDSLSQYKRKFWYVDNFAMKATDINGEIESNNANVNIESLYLDTEEKHFNISDIKIRPIKTRGVSDDYLSGNIDSIFIEGLNYDTGISADELRIENPNIQYYKITKGKKNSSGGKDGIEASKDALNVFNPYANYLSVKDIKLVNANVIVHDFSMKSTYRLNKLNFYAVNFLIDEETRKTARYLFTYDDIGLSFRNFDNLLDDNNYRLQIKSLDLSTLKGSLLMEGIRLIPQTVSWSKAPATYYDINIPSIKLRGFDNLSYLNQKNLKIKSLDIASPHISMVKTADSPKKTKSENNDMSSVFSNIIADAVNINDAEFKYVDEVTADSLTTTLDAFRLNTLQWATGKNFKIGEFILQSPKVDYISRHIAPKSQPQGNTSTKGTDGIIKLLGQKINIGKFSITHGEFDIQQPDKKFNTQLPDFTLAGINWDRNKSFLELSSLDIMNPVISLSQQRKEEVSRADTTKSSKSDIYTILNPYADIASIKGVNISNAKINHTYPSIIVPVQNEMNNTTNLAIEGLQINTVDRKVRMDDMNFNTKDLSLPIIDGYYTLGFGEIDVNKNAGTLKLSDIRMESAYPKMEFSYRHPTHMDWFDVTVGNVSLFGVDYDTYFSDDILHAKQFLLKDVVLLNLKNKKIYTPPKLQPLIYTKLYDIPFGVSFDSTEISNFSVVYEELPKKGTVTGKLAFMGMNATVGGLTNRASHPQQMMRLKAEGKLMGAGYFNAVWDMPVTPDYDCFVLEGHVYRFDLRDLNHMVTPLANAKVKNGILNDLWFRTEASSMNAAVDMRFLYNGLEVNLLKNDEEQSTKKFMSDIANLIIRSNNPNKAKDKPREPSLHITRDPYHSTFNYFWQILQPAIVESVGVSQGKQNFAKKVSGFFTKVKNFFTGKKEDKKPPIPVLGVEPPVEK
ncbi:hypothetical protein [Prevotella sp. 10(H)]|uniref:hypothetical protein n=1 Tax=Prevotella sp. 10(H) TaxID=1158294 RepID=UPI00068A77AA|nr:hypothetical protein [Prevotella sp. 10(H)]